MKRLLIWTGLSALAVALTVLAFLPAAWLGPMVEHQTGGRLTLGDAQGTLWRGSAFIGGAPGPGGAVTPLLPGRFAWTLSPMVLLGQVDMTLENPLALTQPVRLSGSWSQWQVSPSALLLPAATAFWSARLPGWDQGLLAMGVNASVAILVSLVVPSRVTHSTFASATTGPG